MSGSNRYATVARQRAASKRDPLDAYETPDHVTRYLTGAVPFNGPMWECACGSGRMVRVLESAGHRVIGSDITSGVDFLTERAPWAGDVVTNPPYFLADKFVERALALADGRVAMLLTNTFLWGQKRARNLYARTPPDIIIVIPERIYFYHDGVPIKSQTHNHCWVCWPQRAARENPSHVTQLLWARSQPGEMRLR